MLVNSAFKKLFLILGILISPNKNDVKCTNTQYIQNKLKLN